MGRFAIVGKVVAIRNGGEANAEGWSLVILLVGVGGVLRRHRKRWIRNRFKGLKVEKLPYVLKGFKTSQHAS